MIRASETSFTITAGRRGSRRKKFGSDRSGTGDVFTAIVSASVVRGEGLEEAVQKAADFICKVMEYTETLDLPHNAGLAFEEYLTTLQ